ncbi:MAG: ABC transporter permease, partial [Mycobacteriaceae bacterium]
MTGFLLKRLANYIVLLLVATFLAFQLSALAFNPLASLEMRNPRPPQATIDAKAAELRLNEPAPVRYVAWLGDVVLHGDFGRTVTDQPITSELGRRIGVSLRLLLIGAALGTLIGVIVGVAAAIRQYKLSDYFATLFSFVVLSAPVFAIAILLKYGAVAINETTGKQIFLYTGEASFGFTGNLWEQIVDRLQHLVLPTLSLALGQIAYYSRYQRNAMLDVLGSDFLRTAQSKGLTRRKALFKHGLRTALIPMATLFAFGFGTLVVGATFTEKIFGWQGMGDWLIRGIQTQDTNITATVTMFTGVAILFSGFLSDILYAALD